MSLAGSVASDRSIPLKEYIKFTEKQKLEFTTGKLEHQEQFPQFTHSNSQQPFTFSEPEDSRPIKRRFTLATGKPFVDLYRIAANRYSPRSRTSRFNRRYCQRISQWVADINKEKFIKELQKRIDAKYLERVLIHSQPLEDQYGRRSYFSVKIGNHDMQLYMPGTLMLTGAVKDEQQTLAAIHNGLQNGPLMGNSCASFIARFFCHLAYEWERVQWQAGTQMNIGPETAKLFKKVLTKVLSKENFALQDLEEHGRLIEYQDKITELMVQKLPEDYLIYEHVDQEYEILM